jgi:hypothetical protein
LVDPTSITSVEGPMSGRMARSVSPVAATGTDTSTKSAPDAASSADGASTSMTPSARARASVCGERA